MKPQHFRANGCKVSHQFARFMNHAGDRYMVGVCGAYYQVGDVRQVEYKIVPDRVCPKCTATTARIDKEGNRHS